MILIIYNCNILALLFGSLKRGELGVDDLLEEYAKDISPILVIILIELIIIKKMNIILSKLGISGAQV